MKRQENISTRKHIDILPVPKTSRRNKRIKINEEPISNVYPVIDTDLARDNIENDLTAADKQDLQNY